MNEPDAYALEEALQLKERVGEGEVVVLSARAGARGVDAARGAGEGRGSRVAYRDAGGGWGSLAERDTLGVAQMLAEAVRGESPDIVLTGLQSDDLGAGQTGVVLAELLGLPHATLVLSVEASAGAKEIRVKRELEDGWFQHIEMPLPALLTIQIGGNRLRYATLMGIKRARSKETKQSEAAAASARHDEVVRVAIAGAHETDGDVDGSCGPDCGEACGAAEGGGGDLMSSVLVVMEQAGGGGWHRISREALAAGKRLATEMKMPCAAAVLGTTDGLATLTAQLAGEGVAKVWAVEHPLLERYTADAFVAALQQLVAEVEPAFVVFPHTYQVRDYAPALATRMNDVLVSDVIAMHADDGGATFTRQWMGGKLNAQYRHVGSGPCFVSVQAGSFKAETADAGAAAGEVKQFAAEAGGCADSYEAGRAVPRGGAHGRSGFGAGDCERGARDWRAGQSEDCRGAGERAGCGASGIAADLRCGMAADGAAGGELGADGGAEGVCRGGDFGRDSAPGGHEGRDAR